MSAIDRAERDAWRRYWESPTGVANAPSGMVELARRHINALCDELDRLPAIEEPAREEVTLDGHSATLEFDGKYDVARWKFTCTEPVGAECRLVCPQGCEEWCDHDKRDQTECNIVTWLENQDEPCKNETYVMWRGPIGTEWNGDCYDFWPVLEGAPVGLPDDDLSLAIEFARVRKDDELPGVWSYSDFTGGDTDTRSYAQRERDAAAPQVRECPTKHTCMDNYDEEGELTKVLWSDDAIDYDFCPDCGQSLKGGRE